MADVEHVEPGPLMSQATIFNGIAFLAGQIGASGPFPNFEEECEAVLGAVDKLLAKVGSHRGALLHVTVHTRDLSLMAIFNPIWARWLGSVLPPARVAVQTPMVNPAYSVALTCIARVETPSQSAPTDAKLA